MRQVISLAVKGIITAALLYFAIGRTNFSMIGERLGRLDIPWMLAAIALAGIQIVLVSERWRRIAGTCGAELRLPDALRLNTIAAFFNQVLPSTVGGDAMRIWLFARDGAGWSKATYSVLLDRFVGVLALALLVVTCLPWSLQLVANPIGRIALLVIGFGSVGAGLAFVALGYLPWPWLHGFAPLHHLMQMSITARKTLFSAKTCGLAMALSIAVHVLTAAVAWCAARSVAAPFEFWHALMLVLPVVLIATVPISIAGWGLRESALVLAFGYAGLSEADGLLVSVLFGIAMFAIGLIGGAVWLASANSRRANKIQS